MFTNKIIVAVLVLACFSQVQSSIGVPAVTPALRYILVAPQNVRPFAAQVSTFTKDLNLLAAPYAAGVLGGPAIVSRSVVPSNIATYPAVAPAYHGVASAYPAAYPAVAPTYPAVASVYPAIAPAGIVPDGAAPATIYPGSPVPSYPPSPTFASASPLAPNQVVLPDPLLSAHFARSVHAVAPSHAHLAPAAPLYG